MKVLMITSYYAPYIGGAEIYVKEVAERLVKEGNKVIILTKRLGKLKNHEVINGVKVYRVRSLDFPQLRSFFSIPGLFFKGIKMARQSDIIHAHIAYPNGIVAYMIKKATGKPYILTLQGDELMDYPEKKLLKLLKYPIGLALRNARYVHCISNALADKAKQYFGVEDDRIRIIPNGVDIDAFKQARKIDLKRNYNAKKIVIAVSRLSSKNNLEILIRAMRVIGNDVKLVIIGDGVEREKLEALAKKLGVNAEFVGKIGHDKIASYLKGADVFVRTPRTEGLGIAFLEAMAAGLPVIASDVGGIKDIVKNNINGLIVSNNDSKEIAMAIKRILDDKQLREKIIINGKEFVKDYEWHGIYQKTKNLYS